MDSAPNVRGVPPQSVQVVEGPHVPIEHVDDDVTEVGEHPLAGRHALHAHRLSVVIVLGALTHGLGHGADLAGVAGGGQDEEVGEVDQTAQVQDGDVDGLALDARGGEVLREGQDVLFELALGCFGGSFGVGRFGDGRVLRGRGCPLSL